MRIRKISAFRFSLRARARRIRTEDVHGQRTVATGPSVRRTLKSIIIKQRIFILPALTSLLTMIFQMIRKQPVAGSITKEIGFMRLQKGIPARAPSRTLIRMLRMMLMVKQKLSGMNFFGITILPK